MKKILLSILCACVFMVTAHAEASKPDITVTKITTTGVTTNVGFKVKDSNEWLKADADGMWTATSTDTPVQGAIGEKDYSGFFFNANSTSNNQTIGIYDITYALADINDPANGIVVDPTTTGGTLLAKRRIAGIVIPEPEIEIPEFTVPTNYFVIKGSNSLYVIIYNGKVYGTADISKATKFEAYQLANVNHNVSCVQTALAATCTKGGHNAVYQCSICQKYFKEQTCETETTIADEETEALGHDYLVVKDENGKATWTWAEDYSTATLHVVCANDAEHNDNKKTTDITSAVTTVPTAEAEGVLTYTAKVTYNEVEYVGTTTEVIPVLHAVSVVVGEHNYTTFYDGVYDMNIPEGWHAWTATVQGEEIIYDELSQYIPAGTGVLLYHKGAIQTDFLSATDEVENNVTDNVFFGYDADATPTSSVYKYYKLQYSEEENRVGFYWGAENGAPFLCKAHKAYIGVSSFMPAKMFMKLPMDDVATAINSATVANGSLHQVDSYNLSGQKVSANYKGLVIRNGKKAVQK